MIRQFTAIVERDGHSYVAYCPGLGLKVVGNSISDARERLAEAVEVFINTASSEEVKRRQEVYVTQIELADGEKPAHGIAHSGQPAYLKASRHGGMRYFAETLPLARRRGLV
jgi:predicted RNase H-like HicB family nuclease